MPTITMSIGSLVDNHGAASEQHLLFRIHHSIRTGSSGQFFDERLLEPITREAPQIFLTYRKEPGVVGDIHDPAHGLKVIGKYKELGIGDRAELVHTLSKTKNNDVMQFLTKFAGQ